VAGDVEQIDSTIDVVTPENIAFQYQAAGPFRRLPAYLIDFCIRVGIVIVGGVFVTVIGAASLFAALLGLAMLMLLWFVLEWFYGGLFEAYWNGQTPGKRVMGIRVLTTEGQPINGMQAIVRNILRWVDMMPPVPIPFCYELGIPPIPVIPTCLIGLITPMLNRRYQRLGDVVMGTMVVIEERSWLFGVAKLEDPRARQLAQYLPPNYEVNRSLAKALATYVERRRFFVPARRREIAKHLGAPLLEQFGLPSDTSHDLLLCALYYRAFVADHGNDRGADEAAEPSPFAYGAGGAGPPPGPPPQVPQQGPVNIVTEPISARRRLR